MREIRRRQILGAVVRRIGIGGVFCQYALALLMPSMRSRNIERIGKSVIGIAVGPGFYWLDFGFTGQTLPAVWLMPVKAGFRAVLPLIRRLP